jgi:ankyrin repeat protein
MSKLSEAFPYPWAPEEELKAFTKAAATADFAGMTAFLDKYPKDIDSHDRQQMTALMHAAWQGKKDAAALLLARGATVDETSLNLQTPLMLASWKGKKAVAGLLLDNGADIEAQDKTGKTALMFAAEEGDADMVRFLLDRGADMEAKDKFGCTALHTASGKKDNAAVIGLLLDRGANIHARDWQGQVPLITAASCGGIEGAALLLEKGARLETPDDRGWTARVHAGARKKMEMVDFLDDAAKRQAEAKAEKIRAEKEAKHQEWLQETNYSKGLGKNLRAPKPLRIAPKS